MGQAIARNVYGCHYLLKCGCCDKRLEIHYCEDGLEIGCVNGALDDWRELLLPLLDVRSKRVRKSKWVAAGGR